MKKLLLLAPLAGCVINGGSESPPVQLEAGAPEAINFVEVDVGGGPRGAVRHEVCIAADTSAGYIVPLQLIDTGTMAPANGAALQTTPIADLECPTDGFSGWARLEWDTTTGRGLATLQHSATRGVTDETGGTFEQPDAGFELVPHEFSSGGQTLFEGVAFEGYDVVAGELEQVGATTWSLPLHVDYRASGTLEATPVAGVTVRMVWQPFLDPFLIVGGSPGIDAENGTIVTDVHGDAYVLLSDEALCFDYVLFGTTPDGGTALVTSLGCP